MVDDALPVTAPLHHFSHPLHEQDGEREEGSEEGEGGCYRRIVRMRREGHVSARARQKKKKRKETAVPLPV